MMGYMLFIYTFNFFLNVFFCHPQGGAVAPSAPPVRTAMDNVAAKTFSILKLI